MGAYYYLECKKCDEETGGIKGGCPEALIEIWQHRYVFINASRASFIGISFDGSQWEQLMGFIEEHHDHEVILRNSYDDYFPQINDKKFIVVEEKKDDC